MPRTTVVFLWVGLGLAALAPSQLAAQIARPQLGTVLDASGSLRPVIGVAAAASLGDSALDNAISFACSATLCLAKTDAALISFAPANAAGAQTATGASTPTFPGGALIAIDDRVDNTNARAWIYFTQSQQAALWQDGALTMIDFASDGEVLSLRAASDGFDYVVVRDRSRGNPRRGAAHVWIEHYSTSDGSITVTGSIAGAAIGAGSVASSAPLADPFAITAVMLFDGGVLRATPGQLILTRLDGQQMAFPLAGARAFFQAAKGVVEIVAREGLWILRTDPGSEQLALLPGASQGDAAPQGDGSADTAEAGQ
jgi:hypothetical protein